MNKSSDFTSIKALVSYFDSKKSPLTVLTPTINLEKVIITNNQTNRPGLNLFGFFKHFAYKRLQIFGKGEYEYLKVLHKNKELKNIKKFFEYKILGIIFSHNNLPPKQFISMAGECKIPILISKLETSELIDQISDFFSEYLFVKQVVHGLMMEIFGTGVLIKSKSDIPRSESALELIERGHRFVSDDVVNIKLLKDKHLSAYCSNLISHHMEIKGIGIINIAHLFGVKSILKEKQIDFVIELEKYDQNKDYDFIGNQNLYEEILGIKIPKTIVPFSYGGILPILIETATMNHRLKMTGYDPAKEFNKKIIQYSNKKLVSKKL